MSPLELRRYSPDTKEWVKFGEVVPGDKGSISNNLDSGIREIYLFECAEDNSHSIIYRSGFDVDVELPGTSLREVIPDPTKIEVIKELREGESFEMTVKTDQSLKPRQIRFTHK